MAEIRIADVKEIHIDQPLQMFAPDGRSHWCRRLCIVKADGTAEWITFAGASASALALPSDVAEARLDAYAAQARDSADASDEYLAQPPDRKPYTPPVLTEYTLPETEGAVDLAAEADLQLRFHEWKQIALETIEAAIPQVRTIWVHDGQLGFARFLRPGETRREAIACFNADASEGDEARGCRIFENGVQVEAVENQPPMELPF